MVLANLMNIVAFRLNLQAPGSDKQDVYTIVYLLGKDPARFANEYARFLQKLLVGYCITVKKNYSRQSLYSLKLIYSNRSNNLSIK